MDRGWLFALIPLSVGGIFLAFGVHGIRRTRHLRRTGAHAYGYVVRHRTSSGEDGGTRYHPVAAWQTPDGHWHEYASRVGRSWKGRLTVGAPVLVHYDPHAPARAAIDGYDGAGTEWFFTVFGALLTTGTLAVLAAVLLA